MHFPANQVQRHCAASAASLDAHESSAFGSRRISDECRRSATTAILFGLVLNSLGRLQARVW
jgi:hypothetical protein